MLTMSWDYRKGWQAQGNQWSVGSMGARRNVSYPDWDNEAYCLFLIQFKGNRASETEFK